MALPVPTEPDELEVGDELLAHALAESLLDPYMAQPVLAEPDELGDALAAAESSDECEAAPAAAGVGGGA